MKLPWTKEIEALRANVLELEGRVRTLETEPKQPEGKPQRLMTSVRTPALIRKLEAKDRAGMGQTRIVRNVAKGPEKQ